MAVILKQDLVPQDMPGCSEILAASKREAADVTVGTTLFMRHYHVRSEGEYKRQMMARGKVMHHSLGSMIYGSTTDYSTDYDRNYGSLSSFILADSCGQLLCPTGHAVTPIPITEAVRIPSPDEIIQVHVTANMLEEKAKHYAPFLNREKLEADSDELVEGGKVFFERVMNGLDDIGVDTSSPCELFMALKNLGAYVEPREIADTLIETGSHIILISTFNGIALTYAREVLGCLKKANLKAIVIMGGLLNENMPGEELPVDVEENF